MCTLKSQRPKSINSALYSHGRVDVCNVTNIETNTRARGLKEDEVEDYEARWHIRNGEYATGWKFRSWNTGLIKLSYLQTCPEWPLDSRSLHYKGYRISFPIKRGRNVTLTIHLYLAEWLILVELHLYSPSVRSWHLLDFAGRNIKRLREDILWICPPVQQYVTHNMQGQTQRRGRGTAPIRSQICSRRRWVISTTLQPLYPT